MAKKAPVRQRSASSREPELEVSAAFTKRPRKTVIKGELPDLTKTVVPILRKDPITIVEEPRAKATPKKAAAAKPIARAKSVSPPSPGQTPIQRAVQARAKANPGTKAGIVEERIPAEPDWRPPPTLRRQFASEKPMPGDGELPLFAPRPAAILVPPPLPRASAQASAPPRPRAPRAKPPPQPPSTVAAAREAFHEVRRRGLSLTGLFGAGLATVSVLAIVLFYVLPWAQVHSADAVGPTPVRGLPDGNLGQAAVGAGGPTLHAMVEWPLLAWVASMVIGGLLVAIDEIPQVRADRHRFVQLVLLWFLTFFQFLNVLTATRWLGLFANSVLDDGPTPFQMHLYPYVLLVLGGTAFLASVYLLYRKTLYVIVQYQEGATSRKEVDYSFATAILCTVALLMLPLVPLAVEDTSSGRAYVNEVELGAIGPSDPDALHDAAQNHATARNMLWVSFVFAWSSVGIALLGRARRHPAFHGAFIFLFATLAIPILCAGIFEILMFFDLLGHDNLAPALPVVIPAAVVAATIVYAQYVHRTLVPFVKHARLTMDE